ncbi:glycosyltransferase family 9 protein [uncultured Megasphaera sp.]|uniref:glycosyltransferase family 9 protein n=2 Tax=uncultured Megasphaera sp. TaxID=165188 RepID=UPI0025D3FCA0|nr:glycosyltransferase family 9 protein [uncultured Megasphaera sp.]
MTTGGGVGDLIMYTPVLRRIKELYPTCKITIMTIDKTVDVINRIPYIDDVVCIKRGRFLGRYRVLPNLFGQDAVVFTDWQPHILPFAWLFRIKVRAGVPRKGKALTKCLTHSLVNNVAKSTCYAAETNAKIFSEALGISIDGDMSDCDVSIPGDDTKKEVDKLMNDIGIPPHAPFILLTPFTGFERRNWPVKEVIKFLDLVKKKYNIPVIITGKLSDEQEVLPNSPHSLFNQTSILQLIELIRRAKCVVTPDSGPMHIAGALGTFVIPLFSKDLPSRWAPRKNVRQYI